MVTSDFWFAFFCGAVFAPGVIVFIVSVFKLCETRRERP